jgi:hypothetical protein
MGPFEAEVAVLGIVTGWWALAAVSGVNIITTAKISIRTQ